MQLAYPLQATGIAIIVGRCSKTENNVLNIKRVYVVNHNTIKICCCGDIFVEGICPATNRAGRLPRSIVVTGLTVGPAAAASWSLSDAVLNHSINGL
jgi:hypothetical protein